MLGWEAGVGWGGVGGGAYQSLGWLRGDLDYIATPFGHEQRCWEPEQTNVTASLYQIDRLKKRTRSQLLRTLSGFCLTIIVGYLSKTLC